MNGSAAVYRQAAASPRRTRIVAFDKLPSSTRERLDRALANGAPEALLAAPSGIAPLASKGAVLVGVVATVALAWIFHQGFGNAASRGAIQAPMYGALYAVIFAVIGAAIIARVGLRRAQRGALFPSGRYLFPLELFEIERGTMRVTALDTMRSLEARGAKVVLTFEDGYSVAFWPPKGEGSASAAVEITHAIQLAAALVYPRDEARMQRIDPLFEIRRADDWQSIAPDPRDASAKKNLRPLAAAFAIDAVVASALGFAIVPARNALSDDIMFDVAKNTPVAQWIPQRMGDYLERGSRHRDEAFALMVQAAWEDRSLLMRYAARKDGLGALAAETLYKQAASDPNELARFVARRGPKSEEADDKLFEVAKRMDTVATYGTYLEVGKRHVDEAKTLRAEAAFTTAFRSPQVGSLCWFVKENQGSKHEDEAWARIRSMFADAQRDFDAKPPPSAEAATFAHALLDALVERADPRVTIEVVTVGDAALSNAAQELRKKHGDRYLAPGDRFGQDALAPLRHDVRHLVTTWLGKTFKSGTVEGTNASGDDAAEPRPRFMVRLEAVLDGTSTWRKLGSGPDVAYVTPLVGFNVDVTGTVKRETGDVTIHWTRHLEDNTAGLMQTKDFRGKARTLPDLLDDVYQPFLNVVPERIVAGFHDKL